ncbi:30S ribosome-binding factor RbfA [Buchnera aphidicola]|uniref:Ribosome-binding factor A n=1 Tax=Buchnera aphidicola (Therioaphis trifolii) TaxID=1241884 RepID=A0A4D6YPM9_9GAMM|nr:30S ribosome-binding factor RbfA [Buchnera aphidicola]QCI27245.1 30S ribosome-binding factor RbfA [Buchnera aphidicola (Therioaphis trifolii)]
MKFLKKSNNKSFHRSIRISEELKKEISYILKNKLRDPRIHSFITVSEVKVSKDLSYAKIFINDMEDIKFLKKNILKNNVKNIISILQNASGYIRRILCKKIILRKIPILFFYSDNSLIKGIKISNLIKNI